MAHLAHHPKPGLVHCEVMHWIQNCFMGPWSFTDWTFVSKVARLFHSVGEGSALEPITLKPIFVVCAPVHNRNHLAMLR